MTMPYKVSVKAKGNDVNVVVTPRPIVTKPEFSMVVAGRIQDTLIDSKLRNTWVGRMTLKKELISILEDFHEQGMIKPKEDEEE